MFALTNAAMFLHDRKMKKIVRRTRKMTDDQIARGEKREQEQTMEMEKEKEKKKHEVKGTY
jgi:hypothetical protein